MLKLFPVDYIKVEFNTDKWDRNSRLGKGESNCYLCNRRMKEENAFYVWPDECTDSLVSFDLYDDDKIGEWDLDGQKVLTNGCRYVGSTCAKKIPKSFKCK